MRTYIERLLQTDAVRVIDRAVDPRHELAAVVAASQRTDDRAILFRNVRGTAFPVISNVYGSHGRLSSLVGASDGRFSPRMAALIDAAARAPAADPTAADGPDDRVSGRISELPHITFFERDAGPYITAGVFLAREPDTGVANLSFCRSMHVSDQELRVRLAPPHDLFKYQGKAESRGEALEVAILLGPPPEVFLAACASLPIEADELALAASIRGSPLPMRRCRTVNLSFPSDTEIVIEGRILPNVRSPEGPFGEFQGYYVERGDNHVFEVTHVSWRKGAHYHGLVCGSPEDLRALEVSIATRIYKALAGEIPGILDVSCFPAPQHTIVQIKPQYEGHAQRVLVKAFGAHTQYNKIVFVVDEDVDIHDFNDVWWAVISRCRVDRKITIIPDIPSFFRDEAGVHTGRMGIDATKPWGFEKKFERKRIPGAERINLTDYLT